MSDAEHMSDLSPSYSSDKGAKSKQDGNVTQSSSQAVSSEKPSNINIANFLTVVRLVIVPFFIWACVSEGVRAAWVAFLLFAFAALTDKLDGYLARSRGLITDFGKLADSIADKALIAAALILLSVHGLLWWWVTVLLLLREIGITLMRMAVVKEEVMAAGHGGKIKMAAQVVGILFLLVPWNYYFYGVGAQVGLWLGWIAIAVAFYYSYTSAWGYIRDAREIMARAKSTPAH